MTAPGSMTTAAFLDVTPDLEGYRVWSGDHVLARFNTSTSAYHAYAAALLATAWLEDIFANNRGL